MAALIRPAPPEPEREPDIVLGPRGWALVLAYAVVAGIVTAVARSLLLGVFFAVAATIALTLRSAGRWRRGARLEVVRRGAAATAIATLAIWAGLVVAWWLLYPGARG